MANALKRRGSLTIWFDPDMTWDAAPSGKRGRQQTYSDASIQTCLTMKVLFGMALRQTTGFVESLLRLIDLDGTVPNFSTLSRRQKTLKVKIPFRGSQGPLHLLIDSTGIKVEGEGEWSEEDQKTIRGGLLKKSLVSDSLAGLGNLGVAMLGRKERDQLEFFVCGSLRDLLPDDHALVRVDRVLDLSWLSGEVADLYADGFGRPGIDPEAAVRLMLAGFLQGIVHDTAADAGRSGQSGDPLVRRLRDGGGFAGSFLTDAHPAEVGFRAVPGDLCAGGRGLSDGGDRVGRCRAHGCDADPGRCQPWLAGGAASGCG